MALLGAGVALGGSLATAAPAAGAAAGAVVAIDIMCEFECLAPTIYFEARGEPDEGTPAVGHVVVNRA